MRMIAIIEDARVAWKILMHLGDGVDPPSLAEDALPQQSPRKQARFVVVNCGAISHPLIDSDVRPSAVRATPLPARDQQQQAEADTSR